MARAALVLALLGLAVSASVTAQPREGSLQSEIDALKREQAAIRKELAEIKALLRARAASAPAGGAPGDVLVTVERAPALGQADARVTMVEFSDYQCPFCQRYSSQVFPQIVRDYVKTGKVRYVFRDFPIASLHPQAHRLHEAAHCAGDQGRYWEMHDRIFSDPRRAEARDLTTGARALGLDGARFERCLADGVHAPTVRQGLADGEQARVRGTPTFFLGATAPEGGPIQPRRLLVGAQPYPAFRQAIDELLAELR